MPKYTIGLDYGTNSVRGLLVDIATGEELATRVYSYARGQGGVILDPRDPDLARQHPQDYLDGAVAVIRAIVGEASGREDYSPEQIVGLGIDATGSTPIPVDEHGTPLAFLPQFAQNPAAMAYLWKDHTAHAEAAQITALAAKMRPQYLAKCGGGYSAEWFWAKLLHCRRANPDVFDAAYTWVEHADWQPAVLAGQAPTTMKRGVCAAGHKGLYHPSWGGYPDEEFLAALDPELARVRRTLPKRAYPVGEVAGGLTQEWAQKTGLPAGLPISVGAIDAHLGAVGSGIGPGVLVKNLGTSSCDMMVAPLASDLPDIPGLCGIVPELILPGFYGLEAGQAAVGDIYNWFVNDIQPAKQGHDALSLAAEKLAPGQSGLLALDWHNGNRTVLIDPRLTGGVIGLNLHTTPADLYRAWIEATAFGARVIAERLEQYGLGVESVVNCGGISVKSPLVMQIYADVLGRPINIARSAQAAALGAAIAGAVAGGAYPSFTQAMQAMAGLHPRTFTPNPSAQRVYNQLYALYRKVHDAFGVAGAKEDLSHVMKDLLALRDQARPQG